jgi:predicted N-formylglutamate amidohydrolase
LSLILTCEHASGHVPARYAHVLSGRAAEAALKTHRGLDLGAVTLARDLSKLLRVPVLEGRLTRLLIDLNRSAGHENLLSEWSRRLGADDIEELRAIHAAHWNEARARVERAKGQVVHWAIHTFTPVLHGKTRDFDVGLLYDPQRPREVEEASRLRAKLLARGIAVRRNAPYRGVADCLPTAFRRMFPAARYAGLELEVNQELLWHEPDKAKRRHLLQALYEVLAKNRST